MKHTIIIIAIAIAICITSCGPKSEGEDTTLLTTITSVKALVLEENLCIIIEDERDKLKMFKPETDTFIAERILSKEYDTDWRISNQLIKKDTIVTFSTGQTTMKKQLRRVVIKTNDKK